MLLWLAGFAAFCVHIKGLYSRHDTHTDAIIVLTGGPDRINAGLDLLAAQKADKLFISGVDTRVTVEQLIALWKPETQTPPCCVVLGHQAQNTIENAAEARDWIRENDIHSVRLVTADYHMPRARLLFARQMPALDIRLHPIHSGPETLSLGRYFTLIWREYNKTLLTWAGLQMRGGVI